MNDGKYWVVGGTREQVLARSDVVAGGQKLDFVQDEDVLNTVFDLDCGHF